MNRFAAFRASIVAAAALAISACGINSVPAAEETAKAKWADVEAAFQERANLVPNLEQIVMSSAEQERATLGNPENFGEDTGFPIGAPHEGDGDLLAVIFFPLQCVVACRPRLEHRIAPDLGTPSEIHDPTPAMS